MPDLVNPLTGQLGYLLRRASARAMAELGALLAPLGLRPVEASVLRLIASNPGPTQAEIGRCLGIERANMTPLIAGLVRGGLVHKAPVDGRSQALTLTEAGTGAAAEIDRLMKRHEDILRDRLGKAATASLLRALQEPKP